MEHRAEVPVIHRTVNSSLSDRLDTIGWGVLLIMTGALWLVPEEQVPHGAWLIGTGLLLLALNAIRYVYGIRMRTFTVFLGVLALASGLGEFLGVDLPLLAIAFIVIGGSIILRPLVTRTE